MAPGSGMRRFYKRAEAAESEAGYTVLLDGRAVHTPGRALLTLPTRPLAEAIAAEWASREDEVRPQGMALMSLACTAIDLVRPRRAEIVAELTDYGATDLVCYRAAGPAILVERQAQLWQPLLDWAAEVLQAPLSTTEGTLAVAQPDGSLEALGRAVESHDDMALSALATAVKASGSLVIALALAAGRLDPETAFEAAELDASHQIEAWGEDLEATRRRDAVKSDLEAAARFLALLQD
jgi:chaperone required for assembly of F1-ATPase